MKNIINFKTILRIVGIIALVAVIGFLMAACSDESTDPPDDTWTESPVVVTTVGRLTITGLGDYNGKKIWGHR